MIEVVFVEVVEIVVAVVQGVGVVVLLHFGRI